MKEITLFLFLFLFALSGFSQNQHPVYPNLTGAELLEKVVQDFKPQTVLDYGDARDIMYREIYSVNDTVYGVYSGHGIYLPTNVDPSTFLWMSGSSNGINNEHTFPRSKGADEDDGNSHSDLHHLYPTRAGVNSARGNLPFGEIADNQSTGWYYLDQSQSNIPNTNINDYSEKNEQLFEPRESHKGNVARSMFYFYTMYKSAADQADPNFFNRQRSTLCDWFYLDPVDQLEYERTFKIAQYQNGKANPFVLDCNLAIRTYCGDKVALCPNLPIISSDQEPNQVAAPLIFPNPVADVVQIQTAFDTTVNLKLMDFLGRVLINKDFINTTQLNVDSLPAGNYFLSINGMISKLIKK